MAIITLTTDLGTKDSYLASVKACIYSQLKDVKIIDISNHINPFDIQQAAYILRNCFKDFPPGTIHIVSVDDELSASNEHLAVKVHSQYFIGTDNGFFSLLLNEINPEKIVKLNITLTTNCLTFSCKNIFVPAACHLARGGTMEIIGMPVDDFKVKKMELKPVLQSDTIRGAVVYIDRYGNAITNIKKDEFEKVQKGRTFTILFGREDEKITNLSLQYRDVDPAEKLAIFDQNNYLQIAINQGVASKLLGLKLHEIIRIEFR